MKACGLCVHVLTALGVCRFTEVFGGWKKYGHNVSTLAQHRLHPETFPFRFQVMETGDNNNSGFRPRTGKSASQTLLPEVECYLHLLLLLYLIDNKKNKEVHSSTLLLTNFM